MECPKCRNNNSRVIDSRPTDNGRSIRRRRECANCQYRYTTNETIEQGPILVIKRDETRELFNPTKLMNGVIRAAEKRPVTLDQINALALQVEHEIREKYDGEVESKRIGELVMPILYDLDEVAYIRFASVYREFQSKEMFLRELKNMEERQKAERR